MTIREKAQALMDALDACQHIIIDLPDDVRVQQAREALRAELAKDAERWDGSDRRCEHSMKWIKDWYGDPSIPNGTADCSRLECEQCGWIDPNGEKPEQDPDECYERYRDDRLARETP